MCSQCPWRYKASWGCQWIFPWYRVIIYSFLFLQAAEHLKAPIFISPSRASQSAIKAVEKLGGSVICKYYNALSLRDCIKGREDRLDAAPTRRQDIGECIERYIDLHFWPDILRCIEWYTNWRNRGYLSPNALQNNRVVNERWKTLSEQLRKYKTQPISSWGDITSRICRVN